MRIGSLPGPRRDPMKRSRPVVHKATKPTLEGEIAHLRDLDLKGLRVRWQSMFRRQAPSHLPRHLLLAVMAYRLQADELGDLVPDTVRLLKQIGARAPPKPPYGSLQTFICDEPN